MKFNSKCPKCTGIKIGHLESTVDRAAGGSRQVTRVAGVAAERGKFKGALVERGDLWGTVEAYVCTECGFWEEYVVKPDDVPFEMLQGFRWINQEAETKGPFR
jgi:hypothetical protein